MDLTATNCDGSYIDPIRSGNVEMELKFSAPLSETVNAIIYMEYESTFSINSAGRVIKNYA